MRNSSSEFTRRQFLAGSAAAATACGLSLAPLASFAEDDPPAARSAARRVSAVDKLNVAVIGAGGRGAEDLKGVSTENVVALCDCDLPHAAESFHKFPDAKQYQDWRKLLENEKSLDAVVVATPDHNHAFISISAMRMGKHVYCEKPLARTIWEARLMAKTAAENRVMTQMGTQGHAFEGTRQAVEVIRSGAIGEVRELHVWTDRPAGWWPQGEERPTETPPVPEGLDWDVWVGPTAWRPYHPIYVPFKWRGRWDFGTGAIGDMGIHNLDTAFWALELTAPTNVEVRDSAPVAKDGPPLWSIIELHFPARGDKPPVKMMWYDGGKTPPADLFHGEPIPKRDGGSLVIGSKGTLFTRTWHGGQTKDDWFLLLPRKQFADYRPAPTLPRAPKAPGETSHHQEWIAACKGGPRPLSNFGYASVLTESLLLGNVALRSGKRIEWDSENMKAKGLPEADPFIKPEFRKGWTL
jgi:predicted dehydrogenase